MTDDAPKPRPRLEETADRLLVGLAVAALLGLSVLLWFAIARASLTPGAGAAGPLGFGALLAAVAAFLLLRRRLYARVPAVRLLALTLVLLGPLLLVEAVANLTNPRGYQYYANSQRYFHWQVYAGIPQSHAHPKDSKLTLPWGEVRTNREGWRTEEVPETPDPKTFRVLALGDSVMFGWGVGQAETAPAQLQAWLQERVGPGALKGYDRVEVINTGNGSYDSLDELLVLKSRGLAYRPNLVWVLIIGNDFDGRRPYLDQVDYLEQRSPLEPTLIPTLRKTAIPRPPSAGPQTEPWSTAYGTVSHMLNRSFLVISSLSALRKAQARRATRKRPTPKKSVRAVKTAPKTAAKTGPASRPADPYHGMLGRYPYLPEQLACLREIARLCKAADVPLLMSIFEPRGSKLVDAVRGNLADLTPLFEVTFEIKVPYRRYVNSPTDPHWNADGNRVCALVIGEEILEMLRR